LSLCLYAFFSVEVLLLRIMPLLFLHQQVEEVAVVLEVVGVL
jgi:hypothetical protein